MATEKKPAKSTGKKSASKKAEERKIDEESRLSRKKLFGRFQHSPVDLFTLL